MQDPFNISPCKTSGRVDTASFGESMNDIQDGSEVVVDIKKNDGQETILNNI